MSQNGEIFIDTQKIKVMDIGKAMARIRKEVEISRPDMAQMIRITPSALWKIENGKSVPSKETIERFCRQLYIPLARIYIESLEPEDYIID